MTTPEEPKTQPRPKFIERTYRTAVLALLVLIFIMQIITQFVTMAVNVKSNECKAAIASANAITLETQKSLLDEYQKNVYETAENINQQIFLSSEYNFITLQQISVQQQAILQIQAACR